MLTLESQSMIVTKSVLRADRISRIGNKWLGRISLDQTTIEQLAESQAGLLAEGCLGLETMLGRILRTTGLTEASKTVVIYASKEAGGEIYRLLVEAGHCEPARKPPEKWQLGSLVFTSVEGLARFDTQSISIDCVALLDPLGMVYRARSMRTYSGRAHDRPQIIVNFLSDHIRDQVRPPFLMMTMKKAAALPTDAIARAYCLETFWFLDGPTLRFG